MYNLHFMVSIKLHQPFGLAYDNNNLSENKKHSVKDSVKQIWPNDWEARHTLAGQYGYPLSLHRTISPSSKYGL